MYKKNKRAQWNFKWEHNFMRAIKRNCHDIEQKFKLARPSRFLKEKQFSTLRTKRFSFFTQSSVKSIHSQHFSPLSVSLSLSLALSLCLSVYRNPFLRLYLSLCGLQLRKIVYNLFVFFFFQLWETETKTDENALHNLRYIIILKRTESVNKRTVRFSVVFSVVGIKIRSGESKTSKRNETRNNKSIRLIKIMEKPC